ncbi:protein ALWAYS EARLY 3-like isoform X2 [Phragmites australis]|uniref:protein ALWAYS EARLY 3-like isoform X2 n=1 Tax=Phragmites australis TaxID=29695 RepID=UPI002D77F99C|nr:protein ALWAYS EARLY 3-like isoform X2 [Phragmites australis]
MGPAKGSRMINKTIIKGYEDQQQHEDPPSSSKAKQKKRKISDLDPKWSKDELTHFYEAYRQHGKDWKKISLVVGGKSSDMVQSLYSMHRTFLSLPEHQATAMGFIALVTGHHNVSDESANHRVGDQMVRASGKARKHGEVTQQKANEGSHPHNSCHEGTISGFSSSFKKRYYGELVRNSRSRAVGKRTSRIPVIVPTDRNTTDDATQETENVINSTKRKYEEINNDCTNFLKNECSPDGSSGITEANKADQGQIFLDTKVTGDTAICQSQQRLKTIRIQLQKTMDEGQTGKVEHETMMAAKKGNKLVDSLNQHQILSDFISEEDMLVLDVLQSMVNAPSKMSELKINIPSGSLGKTNSALSRRSKEGHSPMDLSKQGKPGKSSASKARQKRHKKLLDAEVPAEAQNISVNNSVLPEAHRVGITEVSSLCSDSGRGEPELSADISAKVYPNAPAEIKPEIRISRRTKRKSKMHCKTKYVSCNEGSDNLQTKELLHCLSSESLRRWCTYEWFYSAVDYPWFSNNEFVHYLNHANLSHVSRLARSEWSTIRSSLGKPRRFSDHFLAVEKEKLEDYREKVRKIYAQLSDGSRDSLPADLARPFSIGQQVIVCHPSSRELCDGKVVMMGRDFYKVHFGNPDLGVDLVKDTDCMPVNWLYNRPDNIRSYLSSNAHSILDVERIPGLASSDNWDQTVNGVTVPTPKRLWLTSDKQLKVESAVNGERPAYKSTSDGTVKSRGRADNIVGHNDELESYISAFVQRSLSQARQMVNEAMQANSEGSDDKEVGTSNQATDYIGPESEADVGDAQLPSNLISNCIATVLSIKRLSDSRHPPANIAGVLERASSMLHPSCPENLAIYKDIESYLSVIANQILALVPTTLGNGPALSYL